MTEQEFIKELEKLSAREDQLFGARRAFDRVREARQSLQDAQTRLINAEIVLQKYLEKL